MKELSWQSIYHKLSVFFSVIAVTVGVLLVTCAGAFAADVGQAQKPTTDLTALSLEDLTNIEVTSVSKKPEKLAEASAAVYVITQKDIRRSGITSIPELLRMVPGMFVSHIDANVWAISARGFAERYAKMLLVLIDGRAVYTPSFSGVYWDVQDVLLEDIERIEVIRGPGATLWGANAVNGVINIITKNAGYTQGALVTTEAGVGEDRALSGVRYGGKLGDNGYYRAYAKYSDRGAFVDASGNKTADGWHQFRGGFRIDKELSERDSLTLQGDAYHGEAGQTLTLALLSPPYGETINDTIVVGGGNLLARWSRVISDTSDMALQLYYDLTKRIDAQYGETRDTWDLDFQRRFASGKRQEIVWGLGYRQTSDQYDNTFWMSLDPASRTDHLLSAFIQDDIRLSKDRLRLTLGSKFEHNSYTGFEVQPNVRLLWMPNERETIWAAVSRAVRTPARGEWDGRANLAAFPDPEGSGLPILASVFGNRDFKSEELLAYELGYRVRPTDTFSLDAAAFYNVYGGVRDLRMSAPFFEAEPTPHIVIPFQMGNYTYGRTYGLEIAANWNMSSNWRLAAGYTWFGERLYFSGGDQGTGGIATKPAVPGHPRNQFHLLSYLDLPNDLELDAALYYVEAFRPSYAPAGFVVPSCVRLDVRLGWRPTRDLDVSVGVRNLLDNRHPEQAPDFNLAATEVPRSVYGKVTWRF